MENVYVSRSLAPDQRIVRPVSFYELIELMTFSQIIFGLPDQMRPGSRQTPALKHLSWVLLDDGSAIDWGHAGTPESTLYLVSSVKALSMSLLPDQKANIFIEPMRRVAQLPDNWAAPSIHTNARNTTPARRAAPLPVLEDNTVSIIVNTSNDDSQVDQQPGQFRLLVDLDTLLLGVIVYPGASTRYMELIAQIVQRTTRAFVARASDPGDRRYKKALSARRRGAQLS
ncbi:MAG: hypothetical protein WBA83_18315 [Burkholderiaceae bacterium]